MLQCWKPEPELRPSFSGLVDSISNFLEGVAGYMDISAFEGNESKVVEPKASDITHFSDNRLEESVSQSQACEPQPEVLDSNNDPYTETSV